MSYFSYFIVAFWVSYCAVVLWMATFVAKQHNRMDESVSNSLAEAQAEVERLRTELKDAKKELAEARKWVPYRRGALEKWGEN